jgi:hypothetical protein
LSDPKKRNIYDQYGAEGVNQADQMGGDMPAGGMPFGHRGGGGGGGGGHHHGMSPEEAQMFFSQFFGGGDPFGSFGGGGGGMGGPGMQFQQQGGGPRGSQRMQADPFASMFGGGGGGHPGFGGSMGGRGMPAGFGGSMGGRGMPAGFGGSMGSGMARREEKRYDAIPTGTVVSLKALVSRPEKNGDRGEVQQYDPRSGRYIVVLEDTEETMSVKASNLLQHVHVKLHGLESKTEWNGQRGTVISWDEPNQRYNVYVMGLRKAVSLRPGNILLEDGTVGKIDGLRSKPELNGKFGTINSFNQTSGRYDVQLSADKILRLKLENIHV